MDGWKNRSPLAYWEARKGIGSALPQVLPKRTEPFVDLKFDLYSDAVAFERDRFQTISEEHNVAIDPTVLTFANHYNHPHKLLVADEEGMIYFLDTGTESSKHKSLATLRIHNHAIFDAKFRPEDPSLQFITASGDMGCALVDFSTQSVVGTFLGHHQNVKCLSWQKDSQNNVFASGGRDGHVMFFDLRSGLHNGSHYPVGYLVNAHSQWTPRQPALFRRAYRVSMPNVSINIDKLREVYTALPKESKNHRTSITDIMFQTSYAFWTAGTADSSIRLWDLRRLNSGKTDSVMSIHMDSGLPFTSLCMDSTRTSLFASSRDNVIYQFNIGPSMDPKPVAQYFGASVSSFYVKCSLSADDEFLGCGSLDGKGYIFKVKQPNAAPVNLIGHTKEEISGVAFNSVDPYQLATTAEDVIVWHAEPYLDRCRPSEVIGTARIDLRGLEQRTPKLRKRERSVCTADLRMPQLSVWLRERSKGGACSPLSSPAAEFRISSEVDVTHSQQSSAAPNGIAISQSTLQSDRKRRTKNLTLSPFFKRVRVEQSPSTLP
ncbi:denticleless protein homolog A-like [Paramacrobiotus metropolitanus]|uniref:denticleless protein homolog A-like n=1 Tax=Paramacrobiotus metropolitanus TaxID=2943436 RepID=UPI00244583AD|nr:denticleless protein homolog A-like [Paramacrobiotus metropolitanus]